MNKVIDSAPRALASLLRLLFWWGLLTAAGVACYVLYLQFAPPTNATVFAEDFASRFRLAIDAAVVPSVGLLLVLLLARLAWWHWGPYLMNPPDYSAIRAREAKERRTPTVAIDAPSQQQIRSHSPTAERGPAPADGSSVWSILSGLLAAFVGFFLWAALTVTTVFGRVDATAGMMVLLPLAAAFILIGRAGLAPVAALWILALTPLAVVTNFLLWAAMREASSFATNGRHSEDADLVCVLLSGALFVGFALLVPRANDEV